MGPSGAVVGDAITAGEGGFVGDGLAGIEFAGEGVGVGLTGMHLTDVVPCGAIYAYADEPLGAGEDDAAMAVIPSVVLVLLKHRELDSYIMMSSSRVNPRAIAANTSISTKAIRRSK